MAVGAAVLVVLSSPFVGQLRAAVQQAVPGRYRQIVAAAIVCAVLATLAWGLAAVRTRRRLRYGLMAAGVAGGAAYAFGTRTGNPDVDLVELFHFVEYGALALLFYRVWRPRDDLRALVYPWLSVMTAGLADEAFQWFIPDRVGELRDVLLNGAAGLCGLLFGAGLDPPERAGAMVSRRGRLALAGASASVTLLTALFVWTIHVGFEIRDADAGAFRSLFRAEELLRAAADRAARWGVAPPATPPPPVSGEDRYLAEALWHIEHRNEATAAGDVPVAWQENLILERYFAPVLDLPALRARWPPEQRADAGARARVARRPYVSEAHPYPIYLWTPASFWTATLAAVVAVVCACLASGGVRAPRRAPAARPEASS